MKNKYIIAVVVACSVLSGLLIVNYAQESSANDVKNKKTAIMQEKTNKRLNDGYEDIKLSHNIKESDYTNLDSFGGVKALSEGKVSGFDDTEFISFASGTIFNECANLEFGSLKPLILIRNDKKEFLICTKNKDGKNIAIVYTIKNGKWERSEKSINGKPILDNGQY